MDAGHICTVVRLPTEASDSPHSGNPIGKKGRGQGREHRGGARCGVIQKYCFHLVSRNRGEIASGAAVGMHINHAGNQIHPAAVDPFRIRVGDGRRNRFDPSVLYRYIPPQKRVRVRIKYMGTEENLFHTVSSIGREEISRCIPIV